MSKHLSRVVIAILVGASLLSLTATAAAAHDPSCGDHPNQNRGFAISSRESLTGEQVGNARLIMGVAQERQLPERAAEIAITAALQASSLKNSPGNSRGLFQQTSRYYPGVEVASPRSATNAFYDRLVTVSSWQTRSIAAAARTVQGARATAAFTRNAPIATSLTDRWWGDTDNPTECPTETATSSANASNSASTSSNNASNSTSTSSSSSASNNSESGATQSQSNRTSTPTTRAAVTPPRITTVTGTNRVVVRGIVVNRTIGTNLQRLLTAASEDGLTLTGSGWRDPARQIALRKQNCGGSSNYSVYQKSPSLCTPPTARPGTSNHEKGLAIDFRNCSTRTTACYKWLNANASRYGLRNLPSEPWHWSVNGR